MSFIESKYVLNWPNLFSASRVFLIAPTLYGLINHLAALTVLAFAAIILSDIADGAVARRIGKSNPYGTLIDHGADATVVVILSTYFSHAGLCHWLLPALIAVAFLHYAFDSRVRPNKSGPRPSTLGRVNGISYFIFIAACVGSYHGHEFYSLDIDAMVTGVLAGAAWLLTATTSLSIWQRTRL